MIRYRIRSKRGVRLVGATQASPLHERCRVNDGRLPNRRSIRLREFDYTENRAYFVTICTTQRICLFGEITDGVMNLSSIGAVVAEAWLDLPNHMPGLLLNTWVVIPNHVHGIVVLPGLSSQPAPPRLPTSGPRSSSLGAAIGGFKSAVSREVNARDLKLARPIWQRNYYERIIRNDQELDATRRYIVDNPLRWDADPDHPRNHPAPSPPPRL